MRNPIQLLQGSFSIFGGNPMLFLGILLIPVLFSLLVALFEPNQATGVMDLTEWSIFILLTLLSVVVNIFMGIALTLAIDNPSLTVKSAYSASTPFFWRYIGLSILMTIIISIGFILLIIPGIILSVWFTFATFVLILERAKIVESLKKSREYVRGKWWGVFGRLLAITLLAVLVMIIFLGISALFSVGETIEVLISTAVSMLIAPVIVGYMYLLYQDVKGQVTRSTSSFAPSSITDGETPASA